MRTAREVEIGTRQWWRERTERYRREEEDNRRRAETIAQMIVAGDLDHPRMSRPERAVYLMKLWSRYERAANGAHRRVRETAKLAREAKQ